MFRVSFWVDETYQKAGYWVYIEAETAEEMIKKVSTIDIFIRFATDALSYELKKEEEIICSGTYEQILEELKSL